jgi:DNA-binding transcriptional regulator LsrR (DeoR family)
MIPEILIRKINKLYFKDNLTMIKISKDLNISYTKVKQIIKDVKNEVVQTRKKRVS